MKHKIISTSMLLLTAMIWGFAFVAQVKGVEIIGSHTINGVRFTIGTLSLLPVVLIFEHGKLEKQKKIKLLWSSALAGSVLFAASTLQQLGIEATGSAGVAGFITGLYMVFIPIVCFLLFKSRITLNAWLGALVALVGLYLLCTKPGEGFSFGFGELLLLCGTFFWTAHVIIIDKLARDLPPLHFSLCQFAVCALWGLSAMFIFEEPSMGAIIDAKWAILYCGVMSVGIAYTLQVVAQRRAEPTFAAIVLSTESVFSAIGGVIFGIDEMTLLGVLGCILMFAGIILSQVKIKKGK